MKCTDVSHTIVTIPVCTPLSHEISTLPESAHPSLPHQFPLMLPNHPCSDFLLNYQISVEGWILVLKDNRKLISGTCKSPHMAKGIKVVDSNRVADELIFKKDIILVLEWVQCNHKNPCVCFRCPSLHLTILLPQPPKCSLQESWKVEEGGRTAGSDTMLAWGWRMGSRGQGVRTVFRSWERQKEDRRGSDPEAREGTPLLAPWFSPVRLFDFWPPEL